MSLKSASRIPLYFDSDMYFVLPNFFISEFRYARTLESGVIIGRDPEFNHQYRVTLRRIRSLCGLLEEILSPFERNLLNSNLKRLMKRTNLLRDLDVFLNDKTRYIAMLPEHKESLDNIFFEISSRQVEEQQQVADWLQSRAYVQTTVVITNSLSRALQFEVISKPISPVPYANKKILEQFNKVRIAAKRITSGSEDKVIHSLRIKCKSLRYLLESFATLYSIDQHKQNVKHLKFLQDQLGDFNDTSTQISFFTHLRKTISTSQVDQKTLKSLTNELKIQHEHARESILGHISQFDQFMKDSTALEVYRS